MHRASRREPAARKLSSVTVDNIGGNRLERQHEPQGYDDVSPNTRACQQPSGQPATATHSISISKGSDQGRIAAEVLAGHSPGKNSR